MLDGRATKEILDKLYAHIPEAARAAVVHRGRDLDRIGPILLPCAVGERVVALTVYYYAIHASRKEFVLVTRNQSLEFTEPFVRISSNCLYGFILGSRRCDCRWQFDRALELMSDQSDNNFCVIFAVDEHGKDIEGGLAGHALLYAAGQYLKQELVFEAYEQNGFKEDDRSNSDVGLILESIGISRFRLLTNNPKRAESFQQLGFGVEAHALEKPYDKYLAEELGVKREKLGHTLDLAGFDANDIEIYGLTSESLDKKR